MSAKSDCLPDCRQKPAESACRRQPVLASMKTTRSDTEFEELGRQLRELRKGARLTQVDLCARAGISRDTLSRVENGGSAETASVQRVAAELGCQFAIERKPLRAADMRRNYAHLHSDEEDE